MKYIYVLLAASIGMLAACSRLNEFDANQKTEIDEGELVERIIFEVPALRFLGEDGETRASLSQDGDDGILFGWEASDTVGIYPNQGSQVFFSMAGGEGSNEANFDGGGWSLRNNSTYSCYYPFVGRMYMNRDAIPVSFTDQEFSPAIQEQAEVPRYAGIRFFLASDPTTTSSGNLRFSFRVLNTVIRIKACGLPAGTYTKLSLTTEEPLFVQEGSFGLEDLKITGKTCSNSLEVALKNFTLTEASTLDNPALVYLTSAPIDLSGKVVTVRIFSDDNSIYLCEKTPTYAYEAHHLGSLKCEMEKKPVIFYTSSDNGIVTPTAPDAFGTRLVSNEYNGSMGMLVFDSDVTKIGENAFKNCTTLSSIIIPESVTSIDKSAFYGCENLSGIDIPESVTSLGENAFYGCKKLTAITIPGGISTINAGAFAGCFDLFSVTIPETVTSIGGSAFENCHKLSDITIPSQMESIGDSAFECCESLTSIVIPESVTTIGAYAFRDCSRLTYITVHAIDVPDGVLDSFHGTGDCPIYVPSESLNAYKTAAGWSNYASRICDHVYVDMGNGMKWATTNVGAVGPDDLGNYFAWGKTEPIVSPLGNYGGNFTDTANAIWGGSWRMPTLAEWQALTDENNYTWIWDNDRKGYTVISKVEGAIDNSIFLPAAGVVAEPGILYVGQEGNYWIPSSYSEGEGYCVTLEQGGIHISDYGFSAGLSVRPIYESNPNGGMEKPNDTGNEIEL